MQVSINQIMVSVVTLIVAVVIVSLVMIPVIDITSQTKVDVNEVNDGAVGFDLSKFTPTDENVPEYSLDVYISGDTVSIDGMGSKTADDMVIMITNDQVLFVKDGAMYYTAGGFTEEYDNITITLTQTEVCGMAYEWVYFPETDGKYASFPNGFQYNVSGEVISVGSFAGVTLISDNDVITSDNEYGLSVDIQSEGESVSGVTYGVYNE